MNIFGIPVVVSPDVKGGGPITFGNLGDEMGFVKIVNGKGEQDMSKGVVITAEQYEQIREIKTKMEATVEHYRIMTLPAGRELDGVVAERVMGWNRSIVSNTDWQLSPPDATDGKVMNVPRYSTDAAAALEIVEKFRLCIIPTETGWLVGQNDPTGNDYIHGSIVDIRLQSSVEEETIALAVCRSGLLVKRSERYNFDPEPG